MNCIFCDIINKKAYSQIVRENEFCLAFIPKDIECDGHLLVVPKAHHASVLEIDKMMLFELMSFLQDTAASLIEEYGFNGFNLLSANGIEAQQSIAHLHFHILPRKSANEFDAWPQLPGGKNIYANA